MRDGVYRVKYGGREFAYEIGGEVSGGRRVVDIHVGADGRVWVDVPAGATAVEVKGAVQKRARWVLGELDAIAERKKHVLPREYVSGETVFYLGRRYVLKVVDQAGVPNVKLLRGKLVVAGPDFRGEAGRERVRREVVKWYRLRASLVFGKRLKALVGGLSWVERVPEWKLLVMQTQWGSCSAHGVLALNPHLVKAPGECVDYVLLHELCHLKEHNHSARFYALLDREMPGWRAVEARLDGLAEMLLNE